MTSSALRALFVSDAIVSARLRKQRSSTRWLEKRGQVHFYSIGTFTLSWTAESGSTRYQLNQSLNGGAATAVYNSTGLSWSSNALASGTYTYVVYACNGN